jgi:hypothetical protein
MIFSSCFNWILNSGLSVGVDRVRVTDPHEVVGSGQLHEPRVRNMRGQI